MIGNKNTAIPISLTSDLNAETHTYFMRSVLVEPYLSTISKVTSEEAYG